MKEEFKKYLTTICKCSVNGKFLVAVSGGVDSVVMVNLFHSAGLNFSIAHCNFQLRGIDSDNDQKFVEALAARMKVPCYVEKFDTTTYSGDSGISIQMAARDLRYKWFEEIADEHGFDHIVIAHNLNDIVETVFLNFARGTGIRGMMGIRAVNNRIVRPLLFASRQMIVTYAKDHSLQWREDSSNSETKYHRNKIRHIVIPALESINPAFIQNALNTIKRLEQAGKLIDFVLMQAKEAVWKEDNGNVYININRLKQFPANEVLLFELLREFGVSQLSEGMLLNTLEATTGKQFHTDTHTITHDRGSLIITPRKDIESHETLIESGVTFLSAPVSLKISRHEHYPGFKIPKSRNIAALDAESLKFPLKLRRWKEGDNFRPLGLKGTKKISDFLINIKMPLPEKKKIWIIESDGRIVWLVNHRIDDRFRITEKTKNILIIDCKE